jgi:hypothetical protein
MCDSFLEEEILEVIAIEFLTQEGLKLFVSFDKNMYLNWTLYALST